MGASSFFIKQLMILAVTCWKSSVNFYLFVQCPEWNSYKKKKNKEIFRTSDVFSDVLLKAETLLSMSFLYLTAAQSI